jgi:hypothetical protein
MVLVLLAMFGCGTTREQMATDQLLLSDAVDQSVGHIDFSPLSGEKVYLDTQYVCGLKEQGFVSADYIISALRQQMVQAGCLLQDARDEAEYVVEARVGTLGRDSHDVNFGIPSNNALNAAATFVSNAPLIPTIPEISLARKKDDHAAAKIAVFAYHRDTKRPVWQSGLSIARSSAQSKWLFGVGPFQSGEIYRGTQFAGGRLASNPFQRAKASTIEFDDPSYRSAAVFDPRMQQKLHERVAGTAAPSDGQTPSLALPASPENADMPLAEHAATQVVSHEQTVEPAAP